MSTLLEYKCPKCGGAIEFDSASQQMKCPYCDSLFDVETMKSYDEAIKNEPDKMQWEKTSGQFVGGGRIKGYVRLYLRSPAAARLYAALIRRQHYVRIVTIRLL